MSNNTPPMKQCSKCGQEFPATTEYWHQDRHGLYSSCKICCRERKRQYYKANRDEIRERKRRYREANRDKMRINTARHRARKQQLPDTFTSEQWQSCLEYWHYTCAVCGSQLRDLFGDVEPHGDHWIPLNNPDCPGTIAENMVCLCNVCNQSKKAKLPDVWIVEQFGKRRAKRIIAKINTYFEWANSL